MKQILYFITIILLSSCNETSINQSIDNLDSINLNKNINKNNLTFSYKLDIKDTNIVNSSNRQIDLLFNGVDGFLNGKRNTDVRFKTKCMECEPFQILQNGLLFGKRLLITDNQIEFYKTDFNISNKDNKIKPICYYTEGNRKKKNFAFKEGSGIMEFNGESCMDAFFVNVKLSFDKGTIEVNNLINASFFEYDLNNDGEEEQYLVGTRNCSQEIVILRIVKK